MSSRLITRRNFFRSSAAGLCAVGGVFGYTWRIEPHWVQVVHRMLPIEGLPDALSGKRLIQISDLHVGPIVDPDYLVRCMHRINDLQPDILAITGDFMSCRRDEQVDATVAVLRHLRSPRLAAVGVLGNHDYGHRWGLGEVAEQLTERLRALDVLVLRNETTDIAGLTIGGIDDYWSPRFNPSPMLRSLQHGRPNLVLCHNPDVADEPVWHSYRGWILCGHTHGGQCKAPFLTPPILPVKNKRYSEGVIDLMNGRMMYINRGLGYMHRVRFNVRPEITVFTLM